MLGRQAKGATTGMEMPGAHGMITGVALSDCRRGGSRGLDRRVVLASGLEAARGSREHRDNRHHGPSGGWKGPRRTGALWI